MVTSKIKRVKYENRGGEREKKKIKGLSMLNQKFVGHTYCL